MNEITPIETEPVIREMKAEDVLELLQILEESGIDVVIDGGWGVDALLGEQTRPHEDVDIAVAHKDVIKVREILGNLGYKEIPRDDSWECNFVLADDKGHQVDVHSYVFEDGKHVYGVAYTPEQLTGTGYINGRQVHCIPPDHMVQFHTGYPLDDNDFKDVKALSDKFGIPVPEEYAPWMNKEAK